MGQRGLLFVLSKQCPCHSAYVFCSIEIAWEKSNQTERICPSPAVTQSGVVHTGFRLERNSWPGKSLYYESKGKIKQWKKLILRKLGCVGWSARVCVCVCVSVWWVMSMSAGTLFFHSCLALLMWHYRALQHYSDYRRWRLQCDTGSLIPQRLVLAAWGDQSSPVELLDTLDLLDWSEAAKGKRFWTRFRKVNGLHGREMMR